MSECWFRVHQLLHCWVEHNPFQGYEEIWVALRFALLLLLALLVAYGWWPVPIIVAALFVAGEILIFNTAVVFVTGGLVDPLRSIVLTMMGYGSLAIAFAPVWIAFRFDSGVRTWDQFVSGIYQSVRTLTTAGPTDPLCTGEKLFASFEALVGIYFLSIILAGYLSWLGDKS
jgi:hypothetical protein